MARIRTIKPEFFTSDDVCALSPLARILYIGLWCEADREGRMIWSPATFKRRYLPDDACKIEKIAGELVERGLVVLYGDGLAFIPSFAKHQHVNPREAESKLPVPDASSRVTDASIPDLHAQVGKEGKGKEGEGREGEGARAQRIPEDWKPSEELAAWATAQGLNASEIAQNFVDYWRAESGAKARKLDWDAAFRVWCRRQTGQPSSRPQARSFDERKRDAASTVTPSNDAGQWTIRLKHWRESRFWNPTTMGPPPGEPGCQVPRGMLEEARQ